MHSQTNNIKILAYLDSSTHELIIEQEITYYNTSNDTLNEIYFHNWANAYKNKKTPLARRFVEKNSSIFHFAKEKNRGNTQIISVFINEEISTWEIDEKNPDILQLHIKQPLFPNKSLKIKVAYLVKIPKDKFTKYGVNSTSYNLRYWYLTPAIYDEKWLLYNNLDIDDIYVDYTNYEIYFTVPKNYTINSDLDMSYETKNDRLHYHLKGNHRLDIELIITKESHFIDYNLEEISIRTDLNSSKLNYELKTAILERAVIFIQDYLGEFPNTKLLINKIEYDKNPVYGLNQLPAFLTPFSANFEWDIKIFKVLTKKYIDQLFLFNRREDSWLADGLQTYLMIKYVEKYYPEIKALGNISKIWGVRSFNIAQLDFNDKYPFVYQFAARKNLDQALTTRADLLSNFNRKIANKYKAGLGLQYLEKYLGEPVLKNAIAHFSSNYSNRKTTSDYFLKIINSTTNIDWFKNGYLQTNKKVDYTIQQIINKGDSLEVIIKNKRNFTTPIELYGLKDKKVIYKKWLTDIDTIAKIKIPNIDLDKLSLNYNFELPEYNLRNNWKNVQKKLFTRPLQIKFLKDVENPYYNQLFYTPKLGFNYYDGLILGLAFTNKTFINKSLNYRLIPSYSTKSISFSGAYSVFYEFLPENKKINKFNIGIGGSHFDYAEDLRYNKIVPFAILEFKKKQYRDITYNRIGASYTMLDKEPSPTETQDLETLKYNVFNIRYGYSKPTILEDIRFSTGFQVSQKFSKLSLNAHYRILTNTNTQLDFRLFAGAFLSNKTNTDFFSFALDRPTDYLFQYQYFGRSETEGFFSQQIIINEGGFKSKLPVQYANQWITTANTSVGIWRWLELYNDIGFVKNKNSKAYFAYDGGIRLNFIQDILEVYFPVYSNLGWEINDPNYSSKIRFVLVLNPKRIYNFLRRGFY